MTLVELRQKFVELSGRYDLVSSTTLWEDSGANFFINAGQNFLDRIITVPESVASVFISIAAGEYSASFQQRCRAIQQVWGNNDANRWFLEKISLKDLKEYYSDLVSEIDQGQPIYYSIADLRALATASKNSLGTFLGLSHDEADAKYNYRGIIIAPPADEDYVIEVVGLFSQPVLTSDEQENYWTLEVPELLLKAALYQLEIFYRNTEGAKDWYNAIMLEAAELDKDGVDEIVADLDDMGD